MQDLIVTLEVPLRLGLFAGILLLMAALEAAFPRRPRRFDRLMRWPANLALTMINTIVVRLLLPVAATGFAITLADSGTGLIRLAGLDGWVAVIIAVVLLDLVIWGQHVVFHRVPWLWRIHRMHHTDLDIDVTTGVRFHPVEILLSMLIKLAAIAMIGAPPEAVLLFELILNAMAMFNHANLRLPEQLDTLLRTLIVTPDMHRVHHSVRPAETDSNFGFNLSAWDRLFGTYRRAPQDGQDGMTAGLAEFQSADELRIDRMLARPFRRD